MNVFYKESTSKIKTKNVSGGGGGGGGERGGEGLSN